MAARIKAALKRAQKRTTRRAERAPAREAPVQQHTAPKRAPSFRGRDVIRRRCACGGGCSKCSAGKSREKRQRRIEIGADNDAYEIEAERMADRVRAAAVANPPAPPAPPGAPRGPPAGSGDAAPPPPADRAAADAARVALRVDRSRARRRCACGGSCSRCSSDERKRARRAPSGTAMRESEETLTAVLPRELGPGRPLDAATRTFMEQQFSYGFEHVRVHTDARAAAAAQAIDAQAYTVGADIVFGAGLFQPTTPRGIHLLAHELTHVVQQGPASSSPAQPKLVQRQAGDAPDTPDRCPTQRTGLGKVAPTPACPRARHAGTTEIARWHFCVDSDQVVRGQTLAQIPNIIASHPQGTRYQVHGNSSVEGSASYNEVLACHRANHVGEKLTAALEDKFARLPPEHRAATLRDRIEVATRGETREFGDDLASNRVVILYAEIPGKPLPDEIGCEEAPVHIGDVPLEAPCDEPTISLEGQGPAPHVAHFNFCFDSDAIDVPGVTTIGTYASKQGSNAVYFVHGFASNEGGVEYNRRLSCHRALRIARELMNAGVRAQQIQEVAGIGMTQAFSQGHTDYAANDRVAVVLAQDAEIASPNAQLGPARSVAEKRAIVSAAREALISGQYRSAADFYISRWTCGHTPTVAQAVERLQISLRDNDKIETIRDEANGSEEDPTRGAGGVVVSNNSLTSDNPAACVMGRLVDMAFHHSVLHEASLPGDLTEPPRQRKPYEMLPPTLRHLAGLHLVSLAGLSACEGRYAEEKVSAAHGPEGIDTPRSADPLPRTGPPNCAPVPQPSRLLGPMPGDDWREHMNFGIHGIQSDRPSGRLVQFRGPEDVADAATAPVSFVTEFQAMSEAASVELLGRPEHFADYEVGYMQTIVDDLFIAEYVDGSRVVQKLPVPIRATQPRGEPPAPAPWMAAQGACARPDARGEVSLSTRWYLETDFALSTSVFRPSTPALLDTWQRNTRVALWLAVRRRGMPLDRFSVRPIGGSVYQVDQSLDLGFARIRGDMLADERDKRYKTDPKTFREPEHDAFDYRTQFRTLEVSDEPADFKLARFDRPVVSEIDVYRQFQRILEPESLTASEGMTKAEYIAAATEILDGMRDWIPSPDDPSQKIEVDNARLGFRHAQLDVEIRLNPETGRILPHLSAKVDDNPVRITSKELGDRARYHIARSLNLRLRKRDVLQSGRPAILKEMPPNGVLTFSIPPLKEKRLIDQPGVKRQMAQMWDCSMRVQESQEHLNDMEFGAAYYLDRNSKLLRLPSGYFAWSCFAGDRLVTNLPCHQLADAQGIGTVHTHPSGDGVDPSPKDLELVAGGGCGGENYIISRSKVILYYPSKTVPLSGSRENVIGTATCPQALPEEKACDDEKN